MSCTYGMWIYPQRLENTHAYIYPKAAMKSDFRVLPSLFSLYCTFEQRYGINDLFHSMIFAKLSSSEKIPY